MVKISSDAGQAKNAPTLILPADQLRRSLLLRQLGKRPFFSVFFSLNPIIARQTFNHVTWFYVLFCFVFCFWFSFCLTTWCQKPL